MHGDVASGSQTEAVAAAVDDLLADSIVPLGVNGGVLSFFSEKLNDIEQEQADIPPHPGASPNSKSSDARGI